MTIPLGPVDETEIEHNGNGHSENTETEDQLDVIKKRLGELKRGNGSLTELTKQELSLLNAVLRSVTEEYREQIFWRQVNFMDEDQALDHVNAFYEAKDLGMDTTFNVSLVFALCSVSQKRGGWNNLSGLIMDTMQFGQHARASSNGKGKNGSQNPRSPLSG